MYIAKIQNILILTKFSLSSCIDFSVSIIRKKRMISTVLLSDYILYSSIKICGRTKNNTL